MDRARVASRTHHGGGEEFVLHVAPRLVERGNDVIVYCWSGYYEN